MTVGDAAGAVDVLIVSLGSTGGLRCGRRRAGRFAAKSRGKRGGCLGHAAAPGSHAGSDRPLVGACRPSRCPSRAGSPHATRDDLLEHHRRAVVAAAGGDPLRRARGRQPTGAPRALAAPAGAPPAAPGAVAAPLERERPARGCRDAAAGMTGSLVLPVAVEAFGPSGPAEVRDIAASPTRPTRLKKGLDRVLAAWRQCGGPARSSSSPAPQRAGPATGRNRVARGGCASDRGCLRCEEYRALLRRARVFVCAPRREDYGIAQLEALADGCMLVSTPAPGPYAALADRPRARPAARERGPGWRPAHCPG